MAESDFEQVLEQYHRAAGEFVKGNAEAGLAFYSRREDVTVANPFAPVAPVARGFEQVAETMRQASSHMRDGKTLGFETIVKHVTPHFAYVVEIERLSTRLDGREEVSPYSLRVTLIFLPERGTWKIIHRHADPITSPRPMDSVIQK